MKINFPFYEKNFNQEVCSLAYQYFLIWAKKEFETNPDLDYQSIIYYPHYPLLRRTENSVVIQMHTLVSNKEDLVKFIKKKIQSVNMEFKTDLFFDLLMRYFVENYKLKKLGTNTTKNQYGSYHFIVDRNLSWFFYYKKTEELTELRKET